MSTYKILLVDDDILILKTVGAFLQFQGYQLATADSGESAIALLKQEDFDLVITDMVMDPIDGLEVLKQAKARNPETMVMMMTGFGDITSVIDSLRLDADDYMLKPCETEEILARVSICLNKLELKRKIRINEERYRESLCNEKENLEIEVRRRTAELVAANEKLKREIEERKRAEKGLRRYELIISTVRDPMSFVDRNYVYRAVNDIYSEYHQKPKAEIIGLTTAQLLGQELFEAYIKQMLDRCFAGEEVHYQKWFDYADGKRKFMDVSYYPFRETDGSVSGAAVSLRDITNLRQTQEMLEKRTDELGERIKELKCLYGIFRLIENKGMKSWDEIFQGIVELIPEGWQYPEITCARLFVEGKEFKTENFRETARGQRRNIYANTEQIGTLEIFYLGAVPDEFPFLKEEDELISAIAGHVGRIIEEKRSDESLKKMNEQLLLEHAQRKELSKRLIDLLEKERRHIAMELHDQVGQTLTSLKISLEMTNEKVDPDDLRNHIKCAGDKVTQAMKELKNVSHGLRPAMLDTLGLVPSLRELFSEVEKQYRHFHIRFFYSKTIPNHFGKAIDIAIYRIAQEALNNAAKYAGADNIFVNLILKAQSVSLSIEDDGAGFDLDRLMEKRENGKHLGLVFMRERVMQLGGEFQIESSRGRGTHVLAELPLEN
jgi:PAS domain S-box-containing protein